MDVRAKLGLLSQAACYDDCTALEGDALAAGRGFFAPAAGESPPGRDLLPCISHVTTPWGERKAVLKILQTSACENNCNYCAFRAGRDIRRAHLTPDELAHSFDLMYRAGLVEGLFLSSGIVGTARTMDEMLATVELVRLKYGFRGYVHLKLLPGVEAAHIAAAVALADRVSANLEAPTPERLSVLAPQKRLAELLGPLRIAAAMIHRTAGTARSPADRETMGFLGSAQGRLDASAPAAAVGPTGWGRGRLGISTQFVVGPAGESDRELLTVAQMLYREAELARTYYSAFSPVRNTPLEVAPPTDPRREHRLYQADWLLRFYRFDVEELPFDAAGQLPSEVDPKLAWAQAHPERFPIEVNVAPVPDLLRVPGIGPQAARAIVAARRQATLRELGDLRKLGARADRAAAFITLAGKRPPHQPPLPF